METRITSSCRLMIAVVSVFALVLLACPEVRAAAGFEGKTVVFIVPFTAGGGTDMLARSVARHLKNYLPGKPAIVIRNITGAGGLTAPNMAWAAKPDGRTVLVTGLNTLLFNIFRTPKVDFRLHEMHPIYSTPTGNVYVAKPGLMKEPRDIVTAKGLIYGDDSANGGNAAAFVWAKELLGFRTEKMIWGYTGGADARGAFLKGELTASGESTVGFNGVMKSYVQRGAAQLLFQSGLLDKDGNVVREAAAPDIPTVPELYEQIHGKKPSGQAYEAYKLIVAGRTYNKAFLLPRNVPADIVDTFETAVAKMVKDPQFEKEMDAMNPGAGHMYGKELVRSYPKAVAGNPDVVTFMKKFLLQEYKLVFD